MTAGFSGAAVSNTTGITALSADDVTADASGVEQTVILDINHDGSTDSSVLINTSEALGAAALSDVVVDSTGFSPGTVDASVDSNGDINVTVSSSAASGTNSVSLTATLNTAGVSPATGVTYEAVGDGSGRSTTDFAVVGASNVTVNDVDGNQLEGNWQDTHDVDVTVTGTAAGVVLKVSGPKGNFTLADDSGGITGTKTFSSVDFSQVANGEEGDEIDINTYAIHKGGVSADAQSSFSWEVLSNSDVTVSASNFGQTYYSGQTIEVDLSSTGLNSGDTVTIRKITSFDGSNPDADTTIGQVTVTSSNTIILDTERFAQVVDVPGNYLLRTGTGSYLDTSGPSFSAALGDANHAEVVDQALNMTFIDNNGDRIDIVQSNESVTLKVSSFNRASFTTWVHATVDGESLNVSQLDTILGNEDDFVKEDSDHSAIAQVPTTDTDKIEFDFSNVSVEGQFNVTMNVQDTTSSDTASTAVLGSFPNNLTYELAIPNDGSTYSIGLPGETNGTLADMINPDAEGYTVFVWSDDDWTPVTDFESQTFSALDAFVVATEGGSNQPDEFSVEIEFDKQATATPPEKQLTEGWNFVAAPKFGAADTLFGLDDAFLVLDRFSQPESPLIQSVDNFDEHYIGSDSNQVSPFKGYFVFVENDAVLPGVLSAETRAEVEEQLDIETGG